MSTLLLIPTAIEQHWAGGLLDRLPDDVHFGLCGFGPVVAGVRAAQLIAEHRPRHVWLLGIAGAMDPQLQIGQAYEFEQVACYGIGVGCGQVFQTAAEIGWPQWSPSGTDPLGDVLPLASASSHRGLPSKQLLTVCAASADAEDVAQHRRKFPLAMAEDMEGFAVAVACQLANTPLRIIRGLSNFAGDREQSHWQSQRAMRAAIHLALASG